MGFVSGLLPGIRGVRTPLVVGYAWLVGVWLALGDADFVHNLALKLAPSSAGLDASFLHGASLVAVSVVAYLVGSLSQVRPYGGVPLTVQDRVGIALSWSDSLKLHIRSPRDLRKEDYDRLALFVMGDDERLLTIGGADVRGLVEAQRQANNVLGLFDAPSAAIRLLIANKELWDSYDRLEEEAELRLSLVFPMALIAGGLFVKVWYLGAVAIGITWLLRRDGYRRASSANSVLLTSLTTGVISDPLVDELRRANRQRLDQEREDRERRGFWRGPVAEDPPE